VGHENRNLLGTFHLLFERIDLALKTFQLFAYSVVFVQKVLSRFKRTVRHKAIDLTSRICELDPCVNVAKNNLN